jgi:hypothetical protein
MCQVAMENGVKFTFQDSFGIGLRSMCRFALNYEEERKCLRLNEKKVCLDVGNSGKYMIWIQR